MTLFCNLFIERPSYLDGWLSADRWTIQVYNQHQGQLSLLSLRGRLFEYRPIWLAL